MLKKQYKLFLIIFILTVCTGAWLSAKTAYTFDTPAVSSYEFILEPSENKTFEDVPAWFTFNNKKSILHVDSNAVCSQILYRHPYGEADTADINSFTYTDDCSGTVLVRADSADGRIMGTAKSQTLISQGYDSLAWDTHNFEDPGIPVELCYSGSAAHSVDLTVLIYGKPYSGPLHLYSAAGKNEERSIKDGVLSGLRISDLRKGLAVSIQDETNGTILSGSYIVEDYPVFKAGYLSILKHFPKTLLLIAAACAVIACVRKLINRAAKKTGPARQVLGSSINAETPDNKLASG